MNKVFKFLVLIILFLAPNAFAIEKGTWSFTKEENWCYIGTIPIKEECKYAQRGDTYLIVYKINNNPESTVQVNAGYNYQEEKPVELIIDNTKFSLFSQGDSAWSSNQDKKIINAMINGKEMTIKGYSFKGTLTKDTYTLIGFTSVYNQLNKDC